MWRGFLKFLGRNLAIIINYYFKAHCFFDLERALFLFKKSWQIYVYYRCIVPLASIFLALKNTFSSGTPCTLLHPMSENQ